MARYDIWIAKGRQWLAEHRRLVIQCFAGVLLFAVACWCYKPTIDTVIQGQPADLEKLASAAESKSSSGKSEMVYDAGKNRRTVSLGNPFVSAAPLTTQAATASIVAEKGLPAVVTQYKHDLVTPLASQMPTVTGFIGSEGQWVAVLSVSGTSRVYRTGERLEAYTVGRITDRIVELRKEGQTVTLGIGGGTNQ